jgi:tetratricopeptide (TPR) repeat protein
MMFALVLGLALAAQSPRFIEAPLAPIAADDRDWAACANRKDRYSVRRRIAGCTAILARPGLPARRRATAFFNRSTAHADAHDVAPALADLDRTLELHANFAMAHNNRGFLYFRRGDHQRARADYDEAMRIDPDLAIVRFNRAALLRATGDEAGANAERDAGKALVRRLGPIYRGVPISRQTVRTPGVPNAAVDD